MKRLVFKTFLKILPNVLAWYIDLRVRILVPNAFVRIKKIKEFTKVSHEKRWDALLHLFSFAIYLIIKILTTEYKNEKNTKKVLEIVMNKTIYFLVHYKNSELSYNKFVTYIDRLFEQKFKDFDKFNLDIKNKKNIVFATADHISALYNTQASEDLKKIIANLYLKLLKIVG